MSREKLAVLAGNPGRVCDPPSLLPRLETREELCSTGIPGGLASLHSRNLVNGAASSSGGEDFEQILQLLLHLRGVAYGPR